MRKLLVLLLLASLFILPATAYVDMNRTLANYSTDIIPTLNESYSDSLFGFLGNNTSAYREADYQEVGLLGVNIIVDMLGPLGLLILFAIPFVVLWMLGRNMIIPAVIGIIFSGFVMARLPAEFVPIAELMIGICVATIIYYLMRDRL